MLDVKHMFDILILGVKIMDKMISISRSGDKGEGENSENNNESYSNQPK